LPLVHRSGRWWNARRYRQAASSARAKTAASPSRTLRAKRYSNKRKSPCVSGLPYWTTDIGGFVSGNPGDPGYRELFIRWFQFGVFNPILRVHGTRSTNQNELWSYGTEAQTLLASYDTCRYRNSPEASGLPFHRTITRSGPMERKPRRFWRVTIRVAIACSRTFT